MPIMVPTMPAACDGDAAVRHGGRARERPRPRSGRCRRCDRAAGLQRCPHRLERGSLTTEQRVDPWDQSRRRDEVVARDVEHTHDRVRVSATVRGREKVQDHLGSPLRELVARSQPQLEHVCLPLIAIWGSGFTFTFRVLPVVSVSVSRLGR
jgi:hypothetical protein